MRRKPSEILKEALALPPDVRASIADSLLESLDQEVEAGASEEWEREIKTGLQKWSRVRSKPFRGVMRANT
jgi:hypothetical protein